MQKRFAAAGFVVALGLLGGPVRADQIAIVTGLVGNDLALLQEQLKAFEQTSGHQVKVVSLPPPPPTSSRSIGCRCRPAIPTSTSIAPTSSGRRNWPSSSST